VTNEDGNYLFNLLVAVHAKTVKCESKFFTFDGDNKKASHNPYQHMVPLEETKTNNAPKLVSCSA
jgi:hypothetical protein